MLLDPPNPPGGSSSLASWLRRLTAAVRSSRLLPGVGYKVKYGSLGTVLEVNPDIGGGRGGLSMCQISTLYGTSVNSADYFSAYAFDGGVTSGTEFNVAKSIPGRMPALSVIEGVTFSYTYVDDSHRTSDDGETTEDQVMFPRFAVGDTAWYAAVNVSGVTVSGADLKKIEVNTAREWVKEFSEV
jgi:hypothetical protein